MFIPYISLAKTSFTIEIWLKPTSFPNTIDHAIFGLCPSINTHQCLHLTIRKISTNYYLYFGFYLNDCQGNTSIGSNQWFHAVFVFDMNTMKQSIYFDGKLDNQCSASAPFLASSGDITIGTIPLQIPAVGLNFYNVSFFCFCIKNALLMIVGMYRVIWII